jgi:hypothetical protein
MTNYVKLGEYTALSMQTRDAAKRRHDLIHKLMNELTVLNTLTDNYQQVFTPDYFTRTFREIADADREMRTALEEANRAAALCGERNIGPEDFSPFYPSGTEVGYAQSDKSNTYR